MEGKPGLVVIFLRDGAKALPLRASILSMIVFALISVYLVAPAIAQSSDAGADKSFFSDQLDPSSDPSYLWETSSIPPLTIDSNTDGSCQEGSNDTVEGRSVNFPPTAVISSPSQDQRFGSDDLISFDGTSSSDPNPMDILTFSWISNISGPLGSASSFSQYLQPGTHNITLMVSDGTEDSYDVVQIYVNPFGDGSITKVFRIMDFVASSYTTVETYRYANGTHCEVWVESGLPVDATPFFMIYENMIYENISSDFGLPTDIDGNGKLTILIVDISGSVAGYFDPRDPNHQDIVYIDHESGVEVLTHEYTHLVHENYDPDEHKWVDEGLAQFAAFSIHGNPQLTSHIRYFEMRPNTTLTWTSYSSDPFENFARYGSAFAFTNYFAQRFGGRPVIGEVLRDGASFEPSEDAHLHGIDGYRQVLKTRGIMDPFEEIFTDWAIAVGVDDTSLSDGNYGFHDLQLNVSMTSDLDSYPVSMEHHSRPWCAEFFSFRGDDDDLSLSFHGDPLNFTVPVVIYFSDGNISITQLTIDESHRGTLLLPDFSTLVDRVLVIPTCLSDTGDSFSLHANYIHLNRPPVAIAGGDRIVLLDEPVHFDAHLSFDPDGDGLLFSWDFDNSDGLSEDSDEISPNWTFSRVGEHIVTLTVIDPYGAIGRMQVNVTVRTNSPPFANSGLDRIAAMGESVSFNGSHSYDPDGDPMSYSWDLDGDGIVDASTMFVTRTYFREGQYIITLTVRDDFDAICSDSLVLTVMDNHAPVADAGSDQLVNIDEVVYFDPLGSYDQDGDELDFEWDFDASDGLAQDFFGRDATYIYKKPGNFTVTLHVEDHRGACSSDTVTVIVNTPPFAEIDPPDNIVVERGVIFSASGSSDADNDPLSFFWDFDASDGSDDIDGEGVEVIYAFSSGGTYIVTLTVKDVRCGKTIASTTIGVSDPRPLDPPIITSPSDGDRVGGTLTIHGGTTQPERLISIDVRMDDGPWTEAKPSTNGWHRWRFVIDTDTIEDGVHRISARARSSEVISGESTITIEIRNAHLDPATVENGPKESSYADGGNNDILDPIFDLFDTKYRATAALASFLLVFFIIILSARRTRSKRAHMSNTHRGDPVVVHTYEDLDEALMYEDGDPVGARIPEAIVLDNGLMYIVECPLCERGFSVGQKMGDDGVSLSCPHCGACGELEGRSISKN